MPTMTQSCGLMLSSVVWNALSMSLGSSVAPRRQDLVGEALFLRMPDGLEHPRRVVGQKSFAEGNLPEQPARFVLGTGEAIDRGHQKIDIPVLLVHRFHDLRIVCRDPHHDTAVAHAFEELFDFALLTIAPTAIGRSAVVHDADRVLFRDLRDQVQIGFDRSGTEQDPLDASSFGAIAVDVGEAAPLCENCHVLMPLRSHCWSVLQMFSGVDHSLMCWLKSLLKCE